MTYSEITERAEIILNAIDSNIDKGHNIDSPDLIDGYKAAFCLANKNIDLYCRSFKDSGLYFSIDSADAIWDDFSDHLFGYQGLSKLERELLSDALEMIQDRLS